MSMKQEGKGVTPDQLFQSVSKNLTNAQNGFQMLFDGLMQMQVEFAKVKEELDQLKGKAMPKSTSMKEPPVKAIVKTRKK